MTPVKYVSNSVTRYTRSITSPTPILGLINEIIIKKKEL